MLDLTMYQEGVPRGAIKIFSPEYEVPYQHWGTARPTMYQEGVPRGAINFFYMSRSVEGGPSGPSSRDGGTWQ